MSTITPFSQLRAYWWKPSKKNPVQVKLRDLRPRNSEFAQYRILARLAAARARLQGAPIFETAQKYRVGILGNYGVVRDANCSLLQHQAD